MSPRSRSIIRIFQKGEGNLVVANAASLWLFFTLVPASIASVASIARIAHIARMACSIRITCTVFCSSHRGYSQS